MAINIYALKNYNYMTPPPQLKTTKYAIHFKSIFIVKRINKESSEIVSDRVDLCPLFP